MKNAARTIKIREREIGGDSTCYIIAEMSANHAGDYGRAIELVHAAKEAGADCIKTQTYTADTITIDCDNDYFRIKKGTWGGENLYNLYNKAYTPWDWQPRLKEEAEKLGMDFFSTAYDKTSVDFLESMGIDFYKIASFELVDIPLIKYIAAKGKPVIMSTGMATLGEIEEAVKAVYAQGNSSLCLLKCSSAYPADPSEMNINTMKHIGETFNAVIGLSDHTMGSLSAVIAVSLGAKVIEKHLCLSRKIENPDAGFSMEPEEFKRMVEDIRATEKAVGVIDYKATDKEAYNRSFRKSIFVVKPIKAGEIFTEENIRVIRPAYGLEPKFFEDIIGRKAAADIDRGVPLSWNMILWHSSKYLSGGKAWMQEI